MSQVIGGALQIGIASQITSELELDCIDSAVSVAAVGSGRITARIAPLAIVRSRLYFVSLDGHEPENTLGPVKRGFAEASLERDHRPTIVGTSENRVTLSRLAMEVQQQTAPPTAGERLRLRQSRLRDTHRKKAWQPDFRRRPTRGG